ncbi:hypothetical protein BGZ96_005450 [Linnemannia gamsii]|uniref:Ion transport domain-containing protein n=1 Tax=Linnemannia gamsii TaxID=64522 RepID=A0ABQ7K6I6_9FUNG|nr:hypothetical protein BGZ96_005450 [Linnemannia gamsii]
MLARVLTIGVRPPVINPRRKEKGLMKPPAPRQWYFKDDSTEGTTIPIGPATLKASSDAVWTNKGSLKDVPLGWYWVVFCVSFEGLDLDQISAMLFDARGGDATNLVAPNKYTSETRITHDEIQKNFKDKARTSMFEVAKNDKYLHLTIGANLRSTNYVLHGYASPLQFISVDCNSSGSEDRPTATKIQAYGFSDKAEFVATLHLRDGHLNTISPITSNEAIIAIDTEDSTSTATANNPTASTASTIGAPRSDSHAVVSIWDIRSPPTNPHYAKLESDHDWDPIQYRMPRAEIATYLKNNLASPTAWESFRASISISTNGTKVALCAIDKYHGDLPFTTFNCAPQPGNNHVGGCRVLTQGTTCKELNKFSGYGDFHRINPDQTDPDDNNDNERFIAFSGPVFEIYNIQSSVWTQIHRITLAQDLGIDRARSYGIAQSLRGRYFAWIENGVVAIWDIQKAERSSLIFVDTDGNDIQAVLSPDGSMVAISVNRSVQIYQRKSGILLGVHTKGVVSDNNSEVVLGNKYFMVKDNSLAPEEPAKIRSIVRIKDMAVVGTYQLQEDYHITYPLSSAALIASFKQGSVLNFKRVTDIDNLNMDDTCGDTPCELGNIDTIEDYRDQRKFSYESQSGEVFLVTTSSQKSQNSRDNIVLRISVDGEDDTLEPRPDPINLFLGDESLHFRGFYLKQPSKLVIFAEGYMTIWKLSATAAHVCQLDYIWGSYCHKRQHAAITSCHRRLSKAWSCRHGSKMRFQLAKPSCVTNQQTIEGDPETPKDDLFTMPPDSKVEKIEPKAVKATEIARFEYGIFGLIDIYGLGDQNRMDETIHYLLTCIRPSTINPTSCLVPLCKAWSSQNRDILIELFEKLLPMLSTVSPTWIPDGQATESIDPLAALLNIAKKDRSVIALARVLIEYLFYHADRSQNLTFLSPLFGNMHEFMAMYLEDALKYMNRIAHFPANNRDQIWKNQVTCRDITPFRFLALSWLRRIFMPESEETRQAALKAIMQFRTNTNKDAEYKGCDLEKPIFIATFDALWFYKDKTKNRINMRRLHGRGEGGSHGRLSSTRRPKTFDIVGHRLHSKGVGWLKVPFQLFWIKIFIRPLPVIECHDFKLEFLDNPAIAALVIFKWSHYNFADLVAFGVPTAAGIQQLILIYTQDAAGNNRALSFSVLIVFLHILLELRINRGICKYVTIIQRAVREITVFIVILAGCILAFTITILHLLKSCPYEGCTRVGTKYPINFISGLSTTSFFLGGRFDAVSDVLDENESMDWSLHLVMIMFLFSTSILLMNVLIALINVAFGKGDDSWRLVWIESRMRYIESAENFSYHIPRIRVAYDLFPSQIYFTTDEIEKYIRKETGKNEKKPEGDAVSLARAIKEVWKAEESMDQNPTLAAIQILDKRLADQAQQIIELTKLVVEFKTPTSSSTSTSSSP